jgi:hypothetical protein
LDPNKFMYLPVLLTTHEVMAHIRDVLPTEGIDLNVVIKAMLDKVFHNHLGRYGKWLGPLGAYRIQAPEVLPMSDFDVDMHLHEAEVFLIDTITGVLPRIPMEMSYYLYLYPGGEDQTNLIVYVPMDKAECPEGLRHKLVPSAAVHYTARRTG